VSLDIHGSFDSVWWKGLLQHLQSVGMRGKAYNLICSYLSDRTLFVVAHSDTSFRRPFTASVVLRVAFGPLYCSTSHFSSNCLFTYADDTTLVKVIPTKDDRFAAATEINAELNRAYLWG